MTTNLELLRKLTQLQSNGAMLAGTDGERCYVSRDDADVIATGKLINLTATVLQHLVIERMRHE